MANNLEVVVVDDEEQITELLQTFISCISRDVNVRAFNSSPEAKNYILNNHVDLLITDYKMPLLDGLQLIEAIPREIKKIMISGYVSDVTEEKLQQLNAQFFEKPVPLRALSKMITEMQDQPK